MSSWTLSVLHRFCTCSAALCDVFTLFISHEMSGILILYQDIEKRCRA